MRAVGASVRVLDPFEPGPGEVVTDPAIAGWQFGAWGRRTPQAGRFRLWFPMGGSSSRAWFVPGTHDASLSEAKTCFFFILALSIPLSVLLVAMLRRAHSLWPNLTGAMGGLAVAGASATVLNLFHPYDAAATDLIVHVGAVVIVVTANWGFADWLFDKKR